MLTLPVIPLRDLVVFPTTIVPLYVGRDKSVAALQYAAENKTQVLLLTQKIPKDQNPNKDTLHTLGTVADIMQIISFPDGTMKIMIEARFTAKVGEFTSNISFLEATCQECIIDLPSALEMKAGMKTIRDAAEELAQLDKRMTPEMLAQFTAAKNWRQLVYSVAANLNIKIEAKQEILEITSGKDLMDKILDTLMGESEVLKVEKKIQNRIKKNVEKSQKEYYLNEQLDAIQKELGNKDDNENEIDDMLAKAKSKNMSVEALTKVTKELKKLKLMSPMSAESSVIRNYVETLLSLPWNDYTVEQRDIEVAEATLNKDHYGLEKVKERILEQLAVLQLNDKAKGAIVCLSGPPGVGKTSLAKSIAEAQNRPFVRISLGGVKDESEIRGHRRTYVGAMPGKIIQAFKKADKGNPLILLDEIDKMSSDYKGDPASAMLEVLDPEQNATFTDHYLDVEYDLSKVLFFATANYIQNIPRPLLDRMEIIKLDGYTPKEKFEIAKAYLIPKQIKDMGLSNINVTFKDDALKTIIESYTREAGVRGLERTIGKVCRKIAKKAVGLKTTKMKSFTVTKKAVIEMLGPEKIKPTETSKKNEIGVVNGMAWTETGGDLLPIEALMMPGKGVLQITGKLGDVMTESAKIAMSYVRSRASLFGIDKSFFEQNDTHIHAPDGSTPKDGPSAGIALTTAMVSAITKIPVKRTVAMTGEVSLTGKVMPIGGLKEKVMAAHRGGIKLIICPKDNEKDIKDIPQDIAAELEFFFAEHVDEVLVRALDIQNPRELFKVTINKDYAIRSQYE